MFLFQLYRVNSRFLNSVGIRNYSAPVNIKKTVFISQSKDIFTNLAFEDWMYKNWNFNNHHVLLMWQSDPCVVIGRHQNPFLEANIGELKNITKCGVSLARRNSGGGTVFHDHGNLNLSFLTTHENYNRRYNLEVISRAVSKEYGLNIEINKREDLVIGDYKVSGTASKLGRPNAYHHCTLLVNVNKEDLSCSLKKTNLNINTNATKSVRSKIMNLSEKIENISVENLMKTIGIEYMRTPAFQGKNKSIYANSPQGFKYVDPSEEQFPGISHSLELFTSWKWIHGKTPKFVIKYSIPLFPSFDCTSSDECIATLTVENGIICEIGLMLPHILNDLNIKNTVESVLQQSIFSLDTFCVIKEILDESVKNQVSVIT
ncbi:lipoyltransferase 1, mitochondrial-like [Harmonia axyridis]|uniref:lipoyltransferase 1, mitochondrial-like n=1 Tax=Harmonia axyridis TaxID=115357 RepID=UPI001E2784FE|nr:lipoyltransferase 1, mitochondrial-like [Harmonia axyridis]